MSLSDRREQWGYWFDPTNNNVYTDPVGINPATPFTFENLWYVRTSPLAKPTQALNFFYAPTAKTAKAVFEWAQKVVGPHASLRLQQEPVKIDPYGYWTFPEWSIYAAKSDFNPDEPESDPFSVGLIASSIIRNGDSETGWAARSFIAELKANKAWIG